MSGNSKFGFINPGRPASGFTLAELLIALAILGVIATFTIPKVLQAQQNMAWKASAKEAAAMISEAYQAYQLREAPTAATHAGNLTPFMNYVRYDTTSSVDQAQGLTPATQPCTTGCLRLHNGALLRYNSSRTFGSLAPTAAIFFQFDPDGKITDGTTNGPGKAVEFDLYINGNIRSWGTALDNTCDDQSCWGNNPNRDPPWFSWD